MDYFDLKGNSIRRAFLKYPIEFTHISSRYSLNRFHPVLKVNRPHLGTDLSATTGTPIRTVGDGTVIEAGYNGGSGNYVKVRHNGTYTTGYLHMSKIGQGIRSGVSVKQGQVIGYVGSTGWATGPHLCYRFWKNGIQVDGLKVEIPPAKPVKKEVLQNFNCVVYETVEKLKSPGDVQEYALALE
jgi:murein DD-endopeptidase MepM/ murein hydrolase activator NlpD